MRSFNLGNRLTYAALKPTVQQLRRVMRMTAILIIVTCLHASATGFTQTVSFTGKEVPIQEVFASVEKQTGLSFFFNYSTIATAKPVTLSVNNVALDAFLDMVLAAQGLDHYRSGKTIFIVKRSPRAEPTAALSADAGGGPSVDIKGTVLNQQGEVLAGATVVVKKGTKSTLTDEKGRFELKGVSSGSVLQISYLGYLKKEVQIGNSGAINIEMTLANNTLDEAQVIAYGSTTERLNVGNLTTVKGQDIQKQPVDNVLKALEGRVPGLFITQTTGMPGSAISVVVEGQNSISKGNDPFYVVDGVPMVSQLLPNLAGVTGNSGGNLTQNGNPLNYLNPSDIESVTVLKDADATAIYGSRAANGAILITTKRGKAGRTKLDLNLTQGGGQVAKRINLLNTQQYIAMRREAYKNNGISAIPSTAYDINGLWDTTRYTDWQKVLLGGTAAYTNLNASVSGGNGSTQYLLGGTYHRESTVFPGNFADQKGVFHFALNNTSADQRFKIQFLGNYLLDNNKLPNVDFTNTARNLPPDAPALYKPDGTLNWMPNTAGTSSWTNPLASMLVHYKDKTTNLVGNAVLSYQIITGLELKASLGYTTLQTDQTVTSPLASARPENRPTTLRTAQYVHNSSNTWLIEPQASYKRPIGQGRLELLVGTTIQQNNASGQQIYGSGYNSDLVLEDPHSASSIIVLSSTIATYKYNAIFSRVNYSLKDEFILNLTARRDGSSRFGSANEFHNFGAVGAGWVFTQENFIKDHLPFLSYGKLRASYGTTGNDQIGDYQYLNLYSPVTAGVAYEGATGLTPTGIPNPYIQWEETRKLDFGVDLGFWNNRILINANYIRNRSSNQLLNLGYPSTVGTAGNLQNFPATVQNTAWEGLFSATVIRNRKFEWSVNFNLTLPQNKLISFPNLSTSFLANNLIVGKPLAFYRLYKYLGVDPATGVYMVADANGKPTTKPVFPTDATVILAKMPRLYGGFGNDLRFKGIELSFLFQFTKRIGPNYWLGNSPGQAQFNQPATVFNRWQTPGDITTHQKFDANGSFSATLNNAAGSNAAYSDASFIRLKNVTLSWQMPSAWMKAAHLQNARIYFEGQNLLTFTGYKGLDPETLSYTTLAPLKIYSFGLQLGL